MELNEFIELFADQFDDTDISEFTPTTKFRDLEEWSSLTQLAELNMIKKKCGIAIKYEDIKGCVTINDLFNLILSKK